MKGISDFERVLLIEGKAPRTIKAYLSKIRQYTRWATERRKGINSESLLEFFIYLKETGRKPSTLKHYHVSLHRYFKFIGVEFPKGLKTPKVDVPAARYFEKDEINLLYSIAKENPLDQAMFALAYDTGARIEEVLTRQRRHFRFDGKLGSCYIHGKTEEQTDSWLPLSESTVRALRQYFKWIEEVEREAGLTSWGFQDYVFHMTLDRSRPYSYWSALKRFKRMCRRAGFRDWKSMGWHMIRHSRATHMLDDGIDPVHIKDQLRHKSLNTTVRYMHKDPEKQRRATAKSDVSEILGDKTVNIKKNPKGTKKARKRKDDSICA
jgi:integrase/recombinase XerD